MAFIKISLFHLPIFCFLINSGAKVDFIMPLKIVWHTFDQLIQGVNSAFVAFTMTDFSEFFSSLYYRLLLMDFLFNFLLKFEYHTLVQDLKKVYLFELLSWPRMYKN